MDRPETRYTKTSDGVHLAYQVVGAGPIDLVYLSSWDLAIDFLWDEPSQTRFFGQLASFSRLILFDKRGTGASDSVSLEAMPTLESWVDDVSTVMEAVGSERAVILATMMTGPLGVLFAATQPDRTAALVLHNTFPRMRSAPDYECGNSYEEIEASVEWVEREWGTGDIWGTFYAPSQAGDERLRRWWNRCTRLSLSPASGVAFTRMMFDSDVRTVLPSIQASTLVVSGEVGRRAARSRYFADNIPDAKLIEASSTDNLPWLNSSLAGDIEEFLTGARRHVHPDRVLATVLFTDFVSSTPKLAEVGDKKWRQILDQHDSIVVHELERYRGRKVNTTGDGVLATFDGPARAVRCAQAICEALHPLGIEVRAGLHTGEVELRGDDIGGIAVHIGQRVSVLAGPGEVLVSRTVTDLVAGSGLEFEDRGEHELKGVPGYWQLYAVKS